uniref:RRM domain-containing protein n=1 Tax=Rhodosorus marinus TaxID=101924 RepID=A0A7S3E9J7_9RHOD|mmetsp:Transcript_19024/g.76423  ORF Transcript_19024/g.76423 Transcript_19024/m.76423 type:complete len:796 (+) Transcript_19024:63-2450(+)|eukprot:CAMPEP_0113968778 /NCGR_PEP_ID=MMETSP0011_2-20120614/9768_1 /TAXON_ID=101924 /ORGANISM="Rhodosorus marinus" /LENGTH=795 /DNA_ID=CAMNT_0000981997 /DNA_START=1 /DNA_END=2388 /DNA_ORIENTATION=+ /assembly_acc=CAM_ASM_000156
MTVKEDPMKSEDEDVNSSGDDDEDSSADEELVEENLKRLNGLLASPEGEWNYETHLELLRVLRNSGEFDKLNEARENMARKFPLPPELWMEWADDLLKIGDWKASLQVLDRGKSDYLSVDLALKSLNVAHKAFLEGLVSEQTLRQMYEDALGECGSVFRNGIRIWHAFIDFEVNLKESGKTTEDRASALLKRLLSLPLQGVEEEASKAKDGSDELKGAAENWNEKLKSHNTKLLNIENRIIEYEKLTPSGSGVSNPELWSAWKALIEYEKKNEIQGLSRVRLAYERSISCCFLLAECWIEYAQFIFEHLHDKKLRVTTLRRAVRNCPWSEELWCQYLRALEASSADKDQIINVLRESILHCQLHRLSTTELSLCYLQFAKRYIDRTESEASYEVRAEAILDALTIALESEEDGSPGWCTVSLFTGKICAELKLEEQSKAVFEKLLQKRGKEAYWWVEYAQTLHKIGDYNAARTALKRGSYVVGSTAEISVLGSAWLEIESLSGSLESYENARSIISKQTQTLEERKRTREEKEQRKTKRARHNDAAPRHEAKVAFHAVAQSESKGETSMDIEGKVPEGQPKGANGEPMGNAKVKTSEKDDELEDNGPEENTVFVSNLSFNLTKDGLAEAFSQIVGLKEARVITRQSDHASRGYGYVEFLSDEGVVEALKLNRKIVEGRPIIVKRSNPAAAAASGRRGRGSGLKGRKDSGSGRSDQSKHQRPKGDAAQKHFSKRLERPHRSIQISGRSLVPATVARKSTEQKKGEQGGEAASMELEEPKKVNMTQDDFRSLLLKKK